MMIDRKELFKIYNFKTWRQSKFQIFLSITAIAIAAAILISLKLVIALNTAYTYNNAKSIYTSTYKMMNNFTNAYITNVIEVKFIDASYTYINKRVGSYAERLGNHKVLINRALADKFQIKKGDTVSLQLLITVVFIIAQTMIFTILPVAISKGIKLNAILRQEEQKFTQNDSGKQKELTLTLTKKLKNAVVLDERDRFNEASKYIQKLTYVFILICFISVFSAVCLIGNILMIINFERLREFLILNVVGAKNRDIRRITIIEGIIIGGVAGVTGCLISEFLSYLLVAESFSSEYSCNVYTFCLKYNID